MIDISGQELGVIGAVILFTWRIYAITVKLLDASREQVTSVITDENETSERLRRLELWAKDAGYRLDRYSVVREYIEAPLRETQGENAASDEERARYLRAVETINRRRRRKLLEAKKNGKT